jgi:hypothetical protein
MKELFLYATETEHRKQRVTSLREGRNMGDDTKFVVMQHEK